MARPTTTSNRPVQYAPEVTRAPGAVVAAQFSAPGSSGAERLANALGVALDNVQPVLNQRIADRATEATNRGIADATVGKVDAKQAAEDEYYARGQKRVLTDKASIEAITEWQSRYDNGEVDKTSIASVNADLNAHMQEKLGSFLSDPEAAQWAVDKLIPYQRQVLGNLQKEQAAQFKLDAIATAGASMRLAVQTGRPVDFEAEKQKLFGAGYSKGEATAELVKQFGQMAVERADPKLLDQIPETWPDGTPGPRSVPPLLATINQDRYYAELALKRNDAEAKDAAEVKATRNVAEANIAAANGNIKKARELLEPLLLSGAIKDSEFRSILTFAEGRLNFGRSESLSAGALARFRADLAEGKFTTEREAHMAALSIVPSGPAGVTTMQALSDDVTSTFRAAQNDNNPLAAAYRSDFDARFKPDASASQAKRNRYAAIMLSFNKTYAKTKDPEKAREAAAKVADSTEQKPGAAPSSKTPQVINGATVTALD